MQGSLIMNDGDISDLRINVRALIDAANFLNNFFYNAPENAQPAIVAVYNALLDVIYTLNTDLAYEEDGEEYISLQYLEANGVSATITLQS